MRALLVQMTSAALLSLGMVGMVAAQPSAPATDGHQTDQTGAQGANAEQSVTIVGCLEQGNPAGAGGERRSETGTSNANDFFVRTPTIAVPAGTTITVGKPGTTDTTTSAGTPTKDSLYRITGLSREQLRPHIGHRVELHGHLTDNTPNTSTTAGTTVDAAGRATTRVETHVNVAGVLHATAIKMVSASCK